MSRDNEDKGKISVKAGGGMVWVVVEGKGDRGEIVRVGLTTDNVVGLVADLLDARSQALRQMVGLEVAR